MEGMEEWKEGFQRFLNSRKNTSMREIMFDLDTITDLELLHWAVTEVDLMYRDNIEIYFFRSSDGEPPVPASIRGL